MIYNTALHFGAGKGKHRIGMSDLFQRVEGPEHATLIRGRIVKFLAGSDKVDK